MIKLIIILAVACVLISLLLIRFRNTTAGFLIRFCWFAIGMGIFFFFFSQNFTFVQNVVMIVITVCGLAYFGYNLNKIMKD